MAGTNLRVVVVFLLATCAGASRAEAVPDRWVGSYSYRYAMGHAVGQPAPAWVFDLTIRADGSCELTWQGYEKDEDILCKASGSEGDLEIYYASSVDGDISNSSQFPAYRLGEKLMELKLIGESGKIRTKWLALNKGGVLKDGVRFERD